ncbi:DEAD/DEAH box helicase [Methyloceanibacter caenitepidi]|uniref:DEAD-box ATP-dependent RNA helicase RhpA n=1 Tax=Methyloceanibacter caenitepidi TaxID=1384459 RepID=A0A0A8K3U9_9HYPH|nr:DEAD/DEAH box helicase [Methyloceanibacter caenitepidi]BAQ17212.1 ATP-dependent RNA helicase Atu1833 [Methyloceanibacter caenitepidi]
MSFSNLGLSPKVESAVEAAGFDTPTPIQAQAIPVAVSGRDVLGIAQTGTGKTASFVLPMLTRLERGRARARMPRTLILEPTRELAAQVAEAFELLGKNHKLTVALLIGGVSYEEQNKKLDRGADVVIATPGRLLDHMERGKLLLNSIEILVVDEADRMLDMGFIPDIERICKVLPFTRQTLFFSATMPPEIQRLADNFLHTPERIEVARPASAASTITQRLKKTGDQPAEKREALRGLIREEDVKNAIIFCNRKKDVGVVFRSLQRHGFTVGALHGDMDQRQRTATLDAFRNGEIPLLVASDVAARGLDIPAVSHVFNYDVPVHPEDYVHRIGRTGRAGREGHAAMLVTPKDHKALKAIEALLREEIAWVDGEPDPQEAEEAKSAGRDNGRGRRRGGRSRRSGQKSSEAKTAEPAKQQQADRKSTDGDARPASKSKPAPKPASKAKANSAGKSRSGQGRDKQPVGMGDHVPAFMMRPVRAT